MATSALREAEACRQRGNAKLSQGDFADAAVEYDKGLVALLSSQDVSVPPLRVALHLNASLAHLKRGNLGSAIDHASGAVASDATCVKAWYRRGVARRALAEHQNEAENLHLAQEDFEKALQLEPQNVEVRRQLQELRDLQKEERKALQKARQASGFRNVFAKPLYDDQGPKAILRETQGKDKALLVSTSALRFEYDDSVVLKSVDLELRAGRCMGMVGLNASGKTTLARLLRGELRPKSGLIQHHFGEEEPMIQSRPSGAGRWLAGGSSVLVLALAIAASGLRWGDHFIEGRGPVAVGFALCLVLCLAAAALAVQWSTWTKKGTQKKPHLVLHLSSETSDKEVIKGHRTVESVIGDALPRSFSPERRRSGVIRLLQAGGFQMYNQETGDPIGNPMEYIRDGLQFGKLSGGQQHLIYILKYIATCRTHKHADMVDLPRGQRGRPSSSLRSSSVLLICDEVLGGLDSIRQPRVLRMLKQLQDHLEVGILYISTELHQIHIMADDLAFLHDGIICELGPAADVLTMPKHAATKDYVMQFRGLPGGQSLGGKLAESYAKLSNDEALMSKWLEMTWS